MKLCELFDRIFRRRQQDPYRDQIHKESHWRPGMANYFENVWLEYRRHVDVDQYSVAIDRGLSLFERYRGAAADFDMQHKGSPFYVLGYAAYASHDFPTASLLFDAAVAEDITLRGAAADTPALLFLRLEDKKQDVLASEIIKDIIPVFEGLLRDYNGRTGSVTLSLDDVRTIFLKPAISSPDEHKRAIVTALISFVAEWRYRSRLIDIVKKGSREPFFLHLFRGCLLFESLLKESVRQPRTNSRETLGGALRRLYVELGIPNNMSISADLFDRDVLSHVTSTLTMPQVIEYTGKSRNTVGHTLVWETPSLTKSKYDDLVKTIASACLHAISTTHR